MKMTTRFGTGALAAALMVALTGFSASAQQKAPEAPATTPAAPAVKKKAPAKKAKAKTAKPKTTAKPKAKTAAPKAAPAKKKAAAAKKPASACVGLKQADCGKKAGCTWLVYKKATDKNGKKLTNHCRVKTAPPKAKAKAKAK